MARIFKNFSYLISLMLTVIYSGFSAQAWSQNISTIQKEYSYSLTPLWSKTGQIIDAQSIIDRRDSCHVNAKYQYRYDPYNSNLELTFQVIVFFPEIQQHKMPEIAHIYLEGLGTSKFKISLPQINRNLFSKTQNISWSGWEYFNEYGSRGKDIEPSQLREGCPNMRFGDDKLFDFLTLTKETGAPWQFQFRFKDNIDVGKLALTQRNDDVNLNRGEEKWMSRADELIESLGNAGDSNLSGELGANINKVPSINSGSNGLLNTQIKRPAVNIPKSVVSNPGFQNRVGVRNYTPPKPIADKDAKPKVRIPPIVTERMLEYGSGHCLMRFDVTKEGKTYNILATSCSAKVFERESIRAVSKWEYDRIYVDGQAVGRTGVEDKVAYILNDANENIIPE